MKHSMFFRMILISNILSHHEATCLNSEVSKYGHFSVESNKTLPISYIISISKLHKSRSKFDNKFIKPFEHAVLMKGKGNTYTTKQWKKKSHLYLDLE